MTLLQIVIVLIAAILLARAINLIALTRWYSRPKPPGSTINVNGKRIYYTLKGEGTPTVVVETALGASSPEWWTIQNELSKTTRVLTYDRAGYGWSEYAPGPRTSRQIATELKELLQELEIDEPVVLVGHSHGGLYVNHFCRLFPDASVGVVLLDPTSPDDARFKHELLPRLYKKSGVDKTKFLKLQSWLSGFGFMRLLKPALLKSPQFEPYRALPRETIDILWHHMLMPKTPQTALREYTQAHDVRNNIDFKKPDSFPPIPLRVITHSSEKVRDEIVRYGGLTKDEAAKVEDLWQELIRAHSGLSPRSKLIIADRSGHSMHIRQPELVVQTIQEVVEEARRSSVNTG